jgi:hypothetical protein
VVTKLEQNWSPEQIAGWLKWAYPTNEARRVSHETIYRSLYVQARGVLKQELMAHLRSQRVFRRSRHATQKRGAKGTIVDAVSISERPPSIEDRAVPGHWEGDLLCGAKNSFIVTLVERHTRYVMLAKVESRHTQTVINALIRQARKLPDELYRSLTWDRGAELADHKRFTLATDIDVYFCDPQSPGSAARTKTSIACCASTSPKEPTSRLTRRLTSTRWRVSSTNDPGKHWTSALRQSDLTSVLPRPVEITDRLRPLTAPARVGVDGSNPASFVR